MNDKEEWSERGVRSHFTTPTHSHAKMIRAATILYKYHLYILLTILEWKRPFSLAVSSKIEKLALQVVNFQNKTKYSFKLQCSFCTLLVFKQGDVVILLFTGNGRRATVFIVAFQHFTEKSSIKKNTRSMILEHFLFYFYKSLCNPEEI